MSTKRGILVLVGVGLLLAASAFAAKPAGSIAPGFDYWQTLGGGATGYAFDTEPLPKGFFCATSEAFDGIVYFEGLPLRTEPSNILGTTDTIVERLDEAAYNHRGYATTRVRVRAMSLAATELLKNSCGQWKVTAGLADRQPVTTMVFHRDNDLGGTFKADLRLRVHMTFTNVATGQTRTVLRTVSMPTVKTTAYAVSPTPVDVVNRCAVAIDVIEKAGSIRLLDGRATSVERPDHSLKLAATTDELRMVNSKATAVTTGCYCDPVTKKCLPTYSWHKPCDNPPPGYDCEKHFTYTPCQLGYVDQCTTPVATSYEEQLKTLRAMGEIFGDPHALLERQLRSADQIRLDFERLGQPQQ